MAGHRMFTQTGTGQWRDRHTLSLFVIVGSILLLNLLLPAALPFWAWLLTQGLLTAFALIVGHGVTGLWFGLLIDSRNKLSLSRLQMLLWTILVLTGFLDAVFANIDAAVSQWIVPIS